jgi:UDP-N-acetylmuramoyl-tripeptide--D-alanyl-D-alanine ligase
VRLTAAEIASATGGRVVGDPGAVALGFTNDSRRATQGSGFVALRGSCDDGHDFVRDALEHGATVALVARVPSGVDPGPGRALVVVDDPLGALGALARAVRARLPGQVVGVTGSTGKTSTKDLLAGALSHVRRTHASEASYNNEVGLPLTLLNAPGDVEVVVAEMGARFPGNIAQLCAIARPAIGVVTNIGIAHAEFLGGVEGIVAVKGELLEALPAHGVAVLDADDPHTAALAARSAAPVVLVGTHRHAEVRLADVRVADDLRTHVRIETPAGPLETELGLRGAHQARNALLAAAVGWWLGVAPDDLATGLARARGSAHRMQLATTPTGTRVLDDSYNANPTSMAAALHSLAHLPVEGRRIAVLGEMRELGRASERLHAEIGRAAVAAHVDVLVAVGGGGDVIARGAEAARDDQHRVEIVRVPDADAATALVGTLAGPGDVVLVKASRAVGLDAVSRALLGAPAAGATPPQGVEP